VHPQSVIHSAVEYADGAVIAQLGTPDMRIPIQYALYYPSRPALSGDRLDLFKLKDLTFEPAHIPVCSEYVQAFFICVLCGR
jgi:1-deoxy-D-xylulose-5-phosphate reductoisomerase